jgi:hypothetical protein
MDIDGRPIPFGDVFNNKVVLITNVASAVLPLPPNPLLLLDIYLFFKLSSFFIKVRKNGESLR